MLQTATNGTLSETSSRSSLYLVTLSSSLIALGFVAGSREILLPFVATVLPAVFLLGVHRHPTGGRRTGDEHLPGGDRPNSRFLPHAGARSRGVLRSPPGSLARGLGQHDSRLRAWHHGGVAHHQRQHAGVHQQLRGGSGRHPPREQSLRPRNLAFPARRHGHCGRSHDPLLPLSTLALSRARERGSHDPGRGRYHGRGVD